MNFITILDKDLKKIRFIKDAINPLVRVTLLGEFTFNFSCLIDNMDYINEKNYIEVDDELFKIRKFKNYRTQQDELLIDVYAEQVSYGLMDPENEIESFNYTQGQPIVAVDLSQTLKTLLAGTGFTYNLDNTKSLPFAVKDKSNKRRVLMQLAYVFGKEIKFQRYDITLKDRIGQDNGVQFRVGKNLLGIYREVDDTQRDEYGNPLISYEFEAVDLSEQYAFEKVDIGDTVKAIDQGLKINVEARALEREYDPILRQTSNLIISNKIPDLADYSIDVEEQLEQNNNDIIDTRDDFENQINETSEGLSLEIQKTNNSLSIIAKDFTDKYNEQQAQLEVMPDKIVGTVEETITDPLTERVKKAEASLNIQSGQIQALVMETNEINNDMFTLSGEISVQAGRVDLVVSGSGPYARINSGQIALAIKDDQSALSLIADHIYIRPYDNIVHFNNTCDIDCTDGTVRMRTDPNRYIQVVNGLWIYDHGEIGSITGNPFGTSVELARVTWVQQWLQDVQNWASNTFALK